MVDLQVPSKMFVLWQLVMFGNFRIMAALNPQTVIRGPCYIVQIKQFKNDFAGDDLLYAVVYKGNSNFGYSRFKNLCEDSNGMFCLTMKINGGKNTTWQNCKEEAEDLPPKGSPILLIEKAYTFAEVGTIAYSMKLFTDPGGLKILSRRTKPPTSCKLVQVLSSAEQASDHVQLTLETAKQQAAQLANIQRVAGVPDSAKNNPSLVQFLHVSADSVPHVGHNVTVTGEQDKLGEDDEQEDEDQGDAVGGEEDINAVVEKRSEEYWKGRALATIARAETAEEENKKLLAKVESMGAKLVASEEQCIKYMAELDLKDQAFKVVTDDISSKVVAKLNPKLEHFKVVKESSEQILEIVKSSPIGRLAGILTEIRHRMESNFDAVGEGVTRINDALDSFGLTESEDSIDIPEALRYLFDVTRSSAQTMGTPVRDEQVQSHICYYKENDIDHIVFTCKCGCGLEVSATFESPDDDEDEIEEITEVPMPLTRKHVIRLLSQLCSLLTLV